MHNDEYFKNDAGKQGAKMMMSRRRKIEKFLSDDDFDYKRKEPSIDYFLTFQMFCEEEVFERLKQVKKKLAEKLLMFKFDGNKYAVFKLNTEEAITDYKLTLEQLEDFAENV